MLAHAWFMHGSCMAHAWLMHGSCMAHAWLMHGSSQILRTYNQQIMKKPTTFPFLNNFSLMKEIVQK
jgi:hypothetical protein